MQNKYIKLTLRLYGSEVEVNTYINSMMICSITRYENYTSVNLMGDVKFDVKETPEEILKLIKEAENITLITK